MKFILSGIPRSGTSLLSTIICKMDNAYCFNECLYNIPKVSDDLGKLKLALMHGNKVPNTYTGNKLTTNTSKENKIDVKKAKGEYDKYCVVGSKINTPYLKYIQYFIDNDDFEKIIFLVRDPVYAIASFHNRKGLNISHVTKNDNDVRFWDIPMVSQDVISRQAEIVNWQFMRIRILNDGYDKVHVVKYENLTEKTPEVLCDISNILGVDYLKDNPVFKNMNDDKRYSENVDMKKVREAVKKYCPERSHFGY